MGGPPVPQYPPPQFLPCPRIGDSPIASILCPSPPPPVLGSSRGPCDPLIPNLWGFNAPPRTGDSPMLSPGFGGPYRDGGTPFSPIPPSQNFGVPGGPFFRCPQFRGPTWRGGSPLPLYSPPNILGSSGRSPVAPPSHFGGKIWGSLWSPGFWDVPPILGCPPSPPATS